MAARFEINCTDVLGLASKGAATLEKNIRTMKGWLLRCAHVDIFHSVWDIEHAHSVAANNEDRQYPKIGTDKLCKERI